MLKQIAEAEYLRACKLREPRVPVARAKSSARRSHTTKTHRYPRMRVPARPVPTLTPPQVQHHFATMRSPACGRCRASGCGAFAREPAQRRMHKAPGHRPPLLPSAEEALPWRRQRVLPSSRSPVGCAWDASSMHRHATSHNTRKVWTEGEERQCAVPAECELSTAGFSCGLASWPAWPARQRRAEGRRGKGRCLAFWRKKTLEAKKKTKSALLSRLCVERAVSLAQPA